MDGLLSSFLYDPPFLSEVRDRPGGGILYLEDFDAEVIDVAERRDEPPEMAAPAIFSQHDLDSARLAGREEGAQLALTDARLVQADLHVAALQSLSDALNAARSSLERTARQTAEAGVRTILAVLQAAVPACMARHAALEADAVLQALLPGLFLMPELRVRAHPDLADHMRECLAGLLPDDGYVLSVIADPLLAPGDVQISWADGGARRDCAAIWNDIRAALLPMGLPSLEEICRDSGC